MTSEDSPLKHARSRLTDPLATRASNFGSLHETLLVTAVTTILVIRTQLWLTNYPQLGGHGLHIAHLLYGGFFMLAAIGLMLTFLGRPVRRLAAVVGGIGFGFFIDELGKFITSDNNYFYKPAAGVIYLIFVGLFLLSRWAQRRGGFTSREYVANALDLVGEAGRHRLDEDERRRALALLDQADQSDPLVAPLRTLLTNIDAIPTPPAPRYLRWASSLQQRLERVTQRPSFVPALVAIFTLWALLSALEAFQLTLSFGTDLGGAHPGFHADGFVHLTVQNVASMGGSLASLILVGIGLVRLRGGDLLACMRWFERALLVAIFVTQVFAFVESQFSAVFGLAIDLVLLAGVRRVAAIARDRATPIAPALTEQEQERERDALLSPVGRAAASAPPPA